jgi:hypothetical protein
MTFEIIGGINGISSGVLETSWGLGESMVKYTIQLPL